MPTSACICVHCGRSFQCERALQKHMACHDDRKLKCEQCSKEFSGVKALKNHERSHKSAECVYCLKTLPKNTKYSHQLTCAERRDSTNFNCDKYSYESPYESNLKKHVIIHEKNKEIKMEKCSFCEFQESI